MEQGAQLWDALWEAGQPHGLIPVGIGVYGTTGRIEKGYRAFGTELETEFTVVEAGMAPPKIKEADFIGKEAHLKHRAEDPVATLCSLTVDDHTSSTGEKRYMMGKEPILTTDKQPITDAHGPPVVRHQRRLGTVGRQARADELPAAGVRRRRHEADRRVPR